MTRKNIFFRVDSSFELGFGHLNRCLIFAKIFQKKKIKVHFICKNLKGNLTSEIKAKGFNIHLIKNLKNSIHYDYQNTRKILKKYEGDISYLVIDNYDWSKKYEKKLRTIVKKIMIIDDLANREHDCDLILDQNFYVDFKHRYDKLVPKNCQKLLGPRFVLLRKEFLTSRRKMKISRLKKIFISFGGQDTSNETIKVLRAIKNSKLEYETINFVIRKSNKNLKRLKILSKEMNGIKIFTVVNKISKIMENSDLSIGAGGSMTWERAYLGIPTIVSIISKNQLEITNTMEKKGCIYNMGWARDVTISDYEKIFQKIKIKDLNTMSGKNKKLVDGRGISRINKKIFSALIKQ